MPKNDDSFEPLKKLEDIFLLRNWTALLLGPFTLIRTILLAIAWFAITENKGK